MQEFKFYISRTIDWKSARGFLRKAVIKCMHCDIKMDDDSRINVCHAVNKLYKKCPKELNWKPFTSPKSGEKFSLDFFVLFKYALIASLKELQTEMLRQIIQASQDYTNLPMDKKSSKKDKPLGNPIE